MNLFLDIHGLTNHSWAYVQSMWILVPTKKLKKISELEVEAKQSWLNKVEVDLHVLLLSLVHHPFRVQP